MKNSNSKVVSIQSRGKLDPQFGVFENISCKCFIHLISKFVKEHSPIGSGYLQGDIEQKHFLGHDDG